eukprot:jgi/Mesvir1/13120/Mv06096-RA.1
MADHSINDHRPTSDFDWEDVARELDNIPDQFKHARFNSVPLVVELLSSEHAEEEHQILKKQRQAIGDIIEHIIGSYHNGFNTSIHNYSQILQLFSSCSEKGEQVGRMLEEARRFLLRARNSQLHQQWFRSLYLREVINLLDVVDEVAKTPEKVDQLLRRRCFYAAALAINKVRAVMERDSVDQVGALQDVLLELQDLTKVTYEKVLHELQDHIYLRGPYSIVAERDNQQRNSADGGDVAEAAAAWGAEGDPERGPGGEGAAIGAPAESVYRSTGMSQWFAGVEHSTEFMAKIAKSEESDADKYCRVLVECIQCIGWGEHAAASLRDSLQVELRGFLATEMVAASTEDLATSNMLSPRGAAKATGLVRSRPSQEWPRSESATSDYSTNGPDGGIEAATVASSPAAVATKEALEHVLDRSCLVLANHRHLIQLLRTTAAEQEALMAPMGRSVTPDVAGASGGRATPPLAGDGEDAVVDSRPQYTLAEVYNCMQGALLDFLCLLLCTTASTLANSESATSDDKDPPIAATSAPTGGLEVAPPAPTGNTGKSSSERIFFQFQLRLAPPTSPTTSPVGARNPFSLRLPPGTPRADPLASGRAGSAWDAVVAAATPRGDVSKMVAVLLPNQDMFPFVRIPAPARVYLSAAVFRPLLQFLDQSEIIAEAATTSSIKKQLRAFVEDYTQETLLPTLRNHYRNRITYSLSAADAFRLQARAHTVYSPLVERGRPVLVGILRAEAVIRELVCWARALPMYAGDITVLVETLHVRMLDKARNLYFETIMGCESGTLAAQRDIIEAMAAHPTDAVLRGAEFAATAAVPGSPMQRRQAMMQSAATSASMPDAALLDLLFKLGPLKRESLLLERSKLVLLGALADSLFYVVESIQGYKDTPGFLYSNRNESRMGSLKLGARAAEKVRENVRLSSTGNQRGEGQALMQVLERASQGSVSPGLSPDNGPLSYAGDGPPGLTLPGRAGNTPTTSGRVLRRNDSTLTTTLADLAERYRQLAYLCLRTLRIEMRLQCIFFLQPLSRGSYNEVADRKEKEGFVALLAKQLSSVEEEMTPYIPEATRVCLFGGLHHLVYAIFMKAVEGMQYVNWRGINLLLRNCSALEQAVLSAGAAGTADPDAQRTMEKLRAYLQLLHLQETSFLAAVAEHPTKFSPKQYLALLKVTVQGRELSPDAEPNLMKLLPLQKPIETDPAAAAPAVAAAPTQ